MRQGRPEPEILRPSWLRREDLWGGFCTRRGGYGEGVFAELNFSWKWRESGCMADQNHDLLALSEGYDRKNLYLVKQVHGSHGFSAETTTPEESIKTPGDFITSSRPGDICAVITADCVPVLIFDETVPCVAAVHSGWRGTLARVGEAAVKVLCQRYGSRPENMLAALGPAIGLCCFEVGEDVESEFKREFPSVAAISKAGEIGRGRPHVDLKKAILHTLHHCGVLPHNVEVLDGCTYCDEEKFFSYRRDGSPLGQHMSFIGLKGTVNSI